MITALVDWLDSRTGYRALGRWAMHEELPSGTGWQFTTGSVVTLLVGCQFITGVGLSMYYVPAPSLAYDSVRFLMHDLPMGWLLRGLHYWGASFLVVGTLSAHVFLLPVTLGVLVVAHIALIRRHGISGPIEPPPGPPVMFFPWHVIKDTVMMATVFASLVTVSALVPAHLDEIANPADANYIPRPEWYFLSLFQMLKYFPGPLEPIATMVIPGAIVAPEMYGETAMPRFKDRLTPAQIDALATYLASRK